MKHDVLLGIDIEDLCPTLSAKLIDAAEARGLRTTVAETLEADRNQRAYAFVPGSHEVKGQEAQMWKGRYGIETLSLPFTGVDRLDKEGCRRAGLSVYYAPAYSTTSVAEQTVALAFAVLRRVTLGQARLRAGEWHDEVVPGENLEGKTVGIIGLGEIGLASARRFQVLGCKVIGWSRSQAARDNLETIGGSAHNDADDVFRYADIVAVHLALDRADPGGTVNFVNADRIDQMSGRGAVLLNCARSEIVDTTALAESMRAEALDGVGIDVFSPDPLIGEDAVKNDPILELDPTKYNVVTTPHVAFKTSTSLENLAAIVMDNVIRSRNGESKNRIVPPPH